MIKALPLSLMELKKYLHKIMAMTVTKHKALIKIGLIIFLSVLYNVSFSQKINVIQQFNNAQQQVMYMLAVIDATKKDTATAKLVSPRSIENGKIKLVKASDWTSGFFPGELWLLYEYTGKQQWLNEARKYTAPIKDQQFNGTTHDLGFMIYKSFGNGYRLTGDTAYRNVIIQAARTLAKRFNPVAGVIRSWDFTMDKWEYPVIIDNMMNLELLFEATTLTGDSSFYKIAVAHANTTMKNHFRADHSSYHVVDYDPATGAVRQKNTAQGYSDASSWARGQAWGLYGYTMCYRETKNIVYLQQAQHIADYILSKLPADKIPYWDYDAPGIPNEPRDASAACIAASALYELARYTNNRNYTKTADKIVSELVKNYLSPVKQNSGFILLHSTGHKPAKSEIDVPIIYADYYFLEALLRSKKME
jgi:unsaturated chondroitin disaccharide hydrolase